MGSHRRESVERILQTVDAISDWSGKVFSLIVGIVMFIIGYEVVARYVFNAPTSWATETMTHLCGIYFIMGGAFTLYTRGHVNVDAVYGLFSLRKRAIIDLLTFPFFFIFVGALLYTSADFAWSAIKIKETTGTVANLPVYPTKIMLSISALLVFLQGLAKFIRDFGTAIRGKEAG